MISTGEVKLEGNTDSEQNQLHEVFLLKDIIINITIFTFTNAQSFLEIKKARSMCIFGGVYFPGMCSAVQARYHFAGNVTFLRAVTLRYPWGADTLPLCSSCLGDIVKKRHSFKIRLRHWMICCEML